MSETTELGFAPSAVVDLVGDRLELPVHWTSPLQYQRDCGTITGNSRDVSSDLIGTETELSLAIELADSPYVHCGEAVFVPVTLSVSTSDGQFHASFSGAVVSSDGTTSTIPVTSPAISLEGPLAESLGGPGENLDLALDASVTAEEVSFEAWLGAVKPSPSAAEDAQEQEPAPNDSPAGAADAGKPPPVVETLMLLKGGGMGSCAHRVSR